MFAAVTTTHSDLCLVLAVVIFVVAAILFAVRQVPANIPLVFTAIGLAVFALAFLVTG
jgi:uncharacterized membrane protein YeiH